MTIVYVTSSVQKISTEKRPSLKRSSVSFEPPLIKPVKLFIKINTINPIKIQDNTAIFSPFSLYLFHYMQHNRKACLNIIIQLSTEESCSTVSEKHFFFRTDEELQFILLCC